MTWKKLCTVIPSSLILVTIGVIGFACGFDANQPSSNLPKPLKDILIWSQPLRNVEVPYIQETGFLAAILLSSIALGTKTDQLADERSDKKVADSVEKYKIEYRKALKELHEKIRGLYPEISPSKKEEINRIFEDFKSLNEGYKEITQELIKVEEWLSLRNYRNLKIMLRCALKTASKYKLNQQQMNAFEQDIKNCMNWLYNSFVDQIYPITLEEHASMMQLSSNMYPLYESAIEAAVTYMKRELRNKNVNLDSIDINYRIDKLSQTLKGFSKAKPSLPQSA